MQYESSSNHFRLISLVTGGDYKYRRWGAARVHTISPCPGAVVLLLGLFLMFIFPFVVVAGPPGPEGGPTPLVTVAHVTEQDVNPPVEYVGHVEAIQAVDLRARVEGFLEQVKFKEGDDVRSGDVLFIIEQAPYRARADADRARVAQARATLMKVRQYLDRMRAVRSGAVSATDIDNAVAEELRARAQLEEAKATLARSLLELGYTTIRAPISGRIGRTNFTRGNLVGPSSGPLARIVQLDPIRVVYSISENDLSAIKTAIRDASKGKKRPTLAPRIKLLNGEILKVLGNVDFVDNEVDAGTGTITVRAVFDNHDGLLLPGQYVTVLVSRSKPKRLPAVPQSAVQVDREGRYVLVVDSQKRVVQRRITTGSVIGTQWAVESGLVPGEMVIVQGIQKVRPGQAVKTTTASEGQGG